MSDFKEIRENVFVDSTGKKASIIIETHSVQPPEYFLKAALALQEKGYDVIVTDNSNMSLELRERAELKGVLFDEKIPYISALVTSAVESAWYKKKKKLVVPLLGVCFGMIFFMIRIQPKISKQQLIKTSNLGSSWTLMK